MSPRRQTASSSVLTTRPTGAYGPFRLGRGPAFERHQHDGHQLAWTASGVLTMGTGESTWVLPRSRALWIPAEVPHTVGVTVPAQMYSLYFRPDECPIRWSEPTVVAVSQLLGELILHLARPDADADPDGARRRAEALVFDLLEPVAVAPLHTPLPLDERARRVAEEIHAHPAEERSLAEWGRAVGASERTLSRRFAAETGLTFTEWRTQARLMAAFPLLAGGAAVASVALDVGYANPSAFIAAFRRQFGMTPRAYFNRPTASSEIR
jgi:AraC-like DNA-binding protein